MKVFSFLALGFCVSLAWAQPNEATKRFQPALPKQPKPPAELIDKVVRDFFSDINTGSIAAAEKIYGARRGFFGANVWIREFAKTSPFYYKIESVEPPKINGDDATVVVHYRLEVKKNDGEDKVPTIEELKTIEPLFTPRRSETLRFKRAATIYYPNLKTWQIVPSDSALAEINELKPNAHLLSDYAFNLAQKPLAEPNLSPQQSLSNLKELGFAARQFTQDFDEQFAFAPEHLQEALGAYVKDTSVFFVPDSYEPYAFNANLSERFIEDLPEGAFTLNPQHPYIRNKERTVLFYEGRDEKPIFRYDGKAAIAFADGNAVLVSPEEAKKLIWKP